MKAALIILTLLTPITWCHGQADSISKNGFFIPRSIKECNQQLDKVLDKKVKNKLKQVDENRLGDILGFYIIDEWFDNDSTRLANYFKHYSIIDWRERDLLIILSYHRKLHNKAFDIGFESERLNDKRNSIKLLERLEYKINVNADSIRGVFIPTDLNSCFSQLDILLNDTTKQDIKSKQTEDNLVEYHMGLGRWMRNYWGLWGGSRLQVFFLNRNVNEPDNMSGIILMGYHKYLKGQPVNAEQLIEEQRIRQEEFIKGVKVETIKFLPPKRRFSLLGFRKDEYQRFLRTHKIRHFDIYERQTLIAQ